ncbi:MAG TPA: 30S ribosomal protein S16 [Nitrospirae bacterium]|nr:30S ribosomal protein S16 [bacterium BMS3Bbin09]HDH34037.1 30S ribosomal protein S16 [Nitrospirota bacterium]HDN94516.1 30S ribosomal protein S16 [Nitrospirota bacterium]HDO67533.1 30S ribosomal protein S16 [Nitrospirota bacterium]HDZ84509.1 30S ribosomal protein S16 [Nitrospirota bacterium]
MVKIRLTRKGAKKKPFYRVIVTDSRVRRDGPFLEIIGTYDPMTDPSDINIDTERAKYWLGVGARPSSTVTKLLKISGM